MDNKLHSSIQLIECPRDAMQGWKHFIPTKDKIRYLNSLLNVGFHTIDFGSFVSPKAIPQLADTNEVIQGLDLSNKGNTKLLCIVANRRGAEDAIRYQQIDCIGFPFSISPSFQKLNTNSSMEQSLKTVEEIQLLCAQHQKEMVVYLSMGFGNPYGDAYSVELLVKWTKEMIDRGIKIISLADTVGMASPDQIKVALQKLIPSNHATNIGVHLHAPKNSWKEKLEAAIGAGCVRIDGAINGIGGCPMAQEELVGNLDSVQLIHYLNEKQELKNIDQKALQQSIQIANEIFI